MNCMWNHPSYTRELGYSALRLNQELVVSHFLPGNDAFVSLCTGSGKSLCYCLRLRFCPATDRVKRILRDCSREGSLASLKYFARAVLYCVCRKEGRGKIRLVNLDRVCVHCRNVGSTRIRLLHRLIII